MYTLIILAFVAVSLAQTTTQAASSTTTAAPGTVTAANACAQHETCTACKNEAGCQFCAASNAADVTTSGAAGECMPDGGDCGTGRSVIGDDDVCLFDEENYCEDTHEKCIDCTNDDRCHWCSSIGSIAGGKDVAGSCRTKHADCKVGDPLNLAECDGAEDTKCAPLDTCTACRKESGCKFCAASNQADVTTAGAAGTCQPDAVDCASGKSEIPDTEECLYDEESYCEDAHDKCIACTNDERCHWCSSLGSSGLTTDKDIAGSCRTKNVDCKAGDPLKLEECDAPAPTIVLASTAAFSALLAQF